jgi:hypothetical protein
MEFSQTAKTEKAWGDYTDEEEDIDKTITTEVTVDKFDQGTPKRFEVDSETQPHEISPDCFQWQHVRSGRRKRREHRKINSTPHRNAKSTPYKKLEDKKTAYERRKNRVQDLISIEPGKTKEHYHSILEMEEKLGGHSHIPTLQYVHSILFTLMNEGNRVKSSFDGNNGVVWGQ